MSPADEPIGDVEPESQPPPADPEVREALDRMEDQRDLPDADDSADDAEEDDLPVDDGEADEGEEAPTG